jgi:hypothetical protein
VTGGSEVKSSVYVIGGANDNNQLLDDMLIFEFDSSETWWILHFLVVMDINVLLGKDMC